MSDEYEEFGLNWEGRAIAVRYQPNWLNSETWHIELRCEERLPVTETGYRSIYVPGLNFDSSADLETYVRKLLDEAAKAKSWQSYVEGSRQFKLL